MQGRPPSCRAAPLVIAHRLSTIRNATRILVFDKGKVIESGTFDELVASGGYFAKPHGHSSWCRSRLQEASTRSCFAPDRKGHVVWDKSVFNLPDFRPRR